MKVSATIPIHVSISNHAINIGICKRFVHDIGYVVMMKGDQNTFVQARTGQVLPLKSEEWLWECEDCQCDIGLEWFHDSMMLNCEIPILNSSSHAPLMLFFHPSITCDGVT